jgi:hypothetical protein
MRQAKAFLVVCAGLFLLALAYHLGVGVAQAQTAVGTQQTGITTHVVMDNGDVYTSNTVCPYGACDQGPWRLCDNLFARGGPVERVIGVGGGYALTEGGRCYWISCDGGSQFDSSVGGGSPFVAFGSRSMPNGCHIYAVTSAGLVFRKYVQCGGSGWEAAGVLPISATPAKAQSWGTLKTIYR